MPVFSFSFVEVGEFAAQAKFLKSSGLTIFIMYSKGLEASGGRQIFSIGAGWSGPGPVGCFHYNILLLSLFACGYTLKFVCFFFYKFFKFS